MGYSQLSLSWQLVEAWLKTVITVCVRIRFWIIILFKDVARGERSPPPPLPLAWSAMMKFCFKHSNPYAQVIYAACIDWIPIVLLTLVTYNIKLYLPDFIPPISFAWRAGPKCWRLNKCTYHKCTYDFFKPLEFCKIFPQIAGNGISETLDFKIFREGHAPRPPRRSPLSKSWLRHFSSDIWLRQDPELGEDCLQVSKSGVRQSKLTGPVLDSLGVEALTWITIATSHSQILFT